MIPARERVVHDNNQETFRPLHSFGIDSLTGIEAELDYATEFLYGSGPLNSHEQYVEDAMGGYSRQTRRSGSAGILGPADILANEVAGLALQQPTVETQVETVRMLMSDHLASMPKASVAIPLMIEGVLGQLDIARSLDRVGKPIISALSQEIANNKDKQYTVMKLLSQRMLTYNSMDSRRIAVLQDLSVFQNGHNMPGSLGLQLRDKLEAGHYDDLVATEILVQAISQLDTNSPERNRNNDLLELIALTKVLTKSNAEAITLLANPAALAHWPSACKTILDIRRSEYSQNLANNTRDSHKGLRDSGYLPPASTLDSFIAARDKFMTVCEGQDAGRRATDIMARVERKRKRMVSPESARQLGSEALNSQVESNEQLPRAQELVFLNARGEASSLPDEELAALLMDSHFKQERFDPSFVKDVIKILGQLKITDMSNGHVPGVGKYRCGVRRGSLAFDTVFGYKPVKVQGLSTTTKKADKLRILFVQHEGKLGLLGMTTRDRIDRLEKSLGMRSGVTN